MRWRRIALAAGIVLASAAAEARAATIGLAGQVRGTDGAPVAGAAVELLPVADLYQTAREATSGDSRPRAARALSDREGFYLLRAPRPGMYAVRVSAAGRVPVEIAALPLVEPAVLPPAELPAAAAANVRVVDGEGRPIAGAALRPIDESVDVDAPRWRPGWPVLRTGADGAVSIPLPGKDAHLPPWTVVAPGLVSQKVEISGPLAIRLELAASTVSLSVRESDGRPVAGAFVAAAGGDLPLAMTGQDGLARFAPAFGPLAVLAADGRVWKGAPPKPKAGAPATVTLPRPAALAGGVVDAEDRAPLAGAVVASTADLGRFAVADARGTYALENAGGEKPGLMAWAAAHFRAEVAVPAGARGTTIALLPGAMLTGRVVDPGQRPIPGAAIEPRSGGMMEFLLARRYPLRPAVSAADGSFAILLPPRSGWSLDVSASGFGPRSVALPALAPRSRPAPITVVLDAGRAATGHLAGPDGAPVAGAVVQILAAGREDALLLTATAGVSRGPALAPEDSGVTTDEQGVFRLQHLPAGRLALVARKPGYAPLVLPGIDLPVGPGTADLGTLQLLPGAVLEGRVTDGRRPLAGARVALAVSGRTLHGGRTMGLPPVETGDDGSFRFADLQPGTTIDLQVTHEGFLGRGLTKVEVPTARPLVVALDRGSRISGRVLDESRVPVAGAWVRADAEDRYLPPAQRFGGGGAAGADGRFTLTSAPAGRVWLEASAQGFQPARVTGLTVPAGGELKDVEIVMKRGGVIAGQVTTDAGLPVAGAEVSAEGGGTETDGDGAFRLGGVAPGRHRVSAAHPDLGRASQEVEVGTGETRVDLRLVRGVSLEGRVADRAGAPVAGASVWLGDRSFPASTTSDAEGGFRFEDVAPGSYRLGAGRGAGARGSSREVQVAGEPLAGLDLVLDPGVVLSGKVLGVRPQDLATLAVEAQAPKGWAGPGEVAADGSYRLEGLASGVWLVTASASATGRRGQGRVEVDEGAAEARLDLELGAGLSLQGTVRVNGRPLDGARVLVHTASEQAAAADVTSHLGAFRLEGLSPGSAMLSVSSQVPWLSEQRTLDLREDATVDVDIAAGALSGSVVDAASGQPLAEAAVTIQKVAENGLMGLPSTSSDAAGHFGFETLAAGAYAVTVQKPGYAPQKVQVSVQPQGTATLVVPLSAAAAAPAAAARP